MDYKRAWNSIVYLYSMYNKTKDSKYLDLSVLYKMAIEWYAVDKENISGGEKFEFHCLLNNVNAEFYTPWKD